MRNLRWLLAFLAVQACVVGSMLWMRSGPDTLVMPIPEWAKPTSDTAAAMTAVASVPTDSPIADMVPPTDLGATLLETKQEMVFMASSPIDEHLSAEVADATVRAVERVWKVYKSTSKPSRIRNSQEFLLAAWPMLGELLRDGHATLDFGPIPDGSRGSYGDAIFSVEDPKGVFIVNLFSPRWLIRLRIDSTRDEDLSTLYNNLLPKPMR